MSKDLIIALIAILIGLAAWGVFGVLHAGNAGNLPPGLERYLKPLPATLNLDLAPQSATVK